MANWHTKPALWLVGLSLAVTLLAGCSGQGVFRPAEAAEGGFIFAQPAAAPVPVEYEVTVEVDGTELQVKIAGGTVRDVLTQAQVELSELDVTVPELDEEIVDGVERVKVTRVAVQEEVVLKRIYFHEIRRPTPTLELGVTRTVQKGREGQRAEYYEVIYEDGVEVSRTLTHTEVVTPKVDRIVEYGTVGVITRNGIDYRFSKVLYVEATAYTAGPESTGKSPGHPLYGITRSGLPVEVGHIAVDPRIIPLLTRVYVEGLDGRGALFEGEYLATDTGSGIRGNKIDIYFEEVADALWFGRRQMKIYVLD